jgi:methionine sulfoxide reductase heme-binding subunit
MATARDYPGNAGDYGYPRDAGYAPGTRDYPDGAQGYPGDSRDYPGAAGPAAGKAGHGTVDAWMARELRLFGRHVQRKKIALWIMGAPAFLPILFMSRAILTHNGADIDTGEADILGTGSEILLLCTLMITPMVTVTRQRWFVPLRKWYGVMLAINATTDGTLASITTVEFAGGPVGRLTGHSFVLVGFTMVMLLIPLALISNNRAQRWLGKYWKTLQRLTYVIWALLIVHLMLLEGFGFQNGTNGPGTGVDGTPILHQRLYQLLACSLFPFVLRLPPVRRWVGEKQKEGREKVVFFVLLPMMLLFLLAFAYIVHEEVFKGVDMFKLNPSNE